MALYIVKKGNLLRHDLLYYEAGEVVEMTEEQALAVVHAIEGPAPPGAQAGGNPVHPLTRRK